MAFTSTSIYNEALNIIKRKNDKLASFDVDSYLYMTTGLKPATKQLEYYKWHIKLPEINSDLIDTFKDNPPEFIVDQILSLDSNWLITIPAIRDQMKNGYIRLKRENKPSGLYILKKRAASISIKEWKELNALHFSQ